MGIVCVCVCILGLVCLCARARMSGACEYIIARKQKLHGRKLCACKYGVSCDAGRFRSALAATLLCRNTVFIIRSLISKFSP